MLLAGIFNAVMDRINMFESSIFSKLPGKYQNWWNPKNAWKNKWKLDENGKPTKEPRFFLSTTLFVFTTDAWHFFQMLWRITITLAIVFYATFAPALSNTYTGNEFIDSLTWLEDFVWFSVAYLIMFNAFFDLILRRRS